MQARQYQQVIQKALSDSRKPNAIKELAAYIVGRMEKYEELMDLIGDDDVLINTSESVMAPLAPLTQAVPRTGVLFTEHVPISQIDIGARVVEKQYSIDEIQALKGEINRRYQAELPMEIQAQPPGFTQPISVFRGNISSSPGAMPSMKITYAPAGAQTEQQQIPITITVTGNIPTAEQIIQEVVTAANRMFSSAPRAIQNHALLNTGQTLDPNLAISTETDDPSRPGGMAGMMESAQFWNKHTLPVTLQNGVPVVRQDINWRAAVSGDEQ